MPKKKSVFDPFWVEATIGDHVFEIRPQPLRKILEFESVVEQLSSQFDDLADEFYVTDLDTGDDVAGPFTTHELASDHIQTEGLENVTVRVQGVPISDLLDRLIASPFVILQPLIPGLEEEHLQDISLPELQFLFKQIIAVNGFEWFEKLLKNLVEPLLPKLTDLTAGAVAEFLRTGTTNFTGIPAATSGEAQSTSS